MEIEFLGVGGAFNPELGNSNMIIWDEKPLLIDCGYTTFQTLKEKNYLDKIKQIFISHTHGDHVGSLDTLLYYKRFVSDETIIFHKVNRIANYLRVVDSMFFKEYDKYFEDPEKRLEMFPVKHATDHDSIALIYGKCVISTDTSEPLPLDVMEEQEIIFHDVSFVNYEGNVHPYIGELEKLPEEIKQKMWLYHYSPKDYEESHTKVLGMGFAGMVQQGQKFEI